MFFFDYFTVTHLVGEKERTPAFSFDYKLNDDGTLQSHCSNIQLIKDRGGGRRGSSTHTRDQAMVNKMGKFLRRNWTVGMSKMLLVGPDILLLNTGDS